MYRFLYSFVLIFELWICNFIKNSRLFHYPRVNMINLEFSLKNNKLFGMVESPRREDRGSSTPSTPERPVSKNICFSCSTVLKINLEIKSGVVYTGTDPEACWRLNYIHIIIIEVNLSQLFGNWWFYISAESKWSCFTWDIFAYPLIEHITFESYLGISYTTENTVEAMKRDFPE